MTKWLPTAVAVNLLLGIPGVATVIGAVAAMGCPRVRHSLGGAEEGDDKSALPSALGRPAQSRVVRAAIANERRERLPASPAAHAER